MIRMLRDFTIYLPDNSEFTFRRGYSYLSEEIGGKTYVMSVDNRHFFSLTINNPTSYFFILN